MACIKSYGGAEVVTGSCHLLKLKCKKSIMIDCGMFQGLEEKKNSKEFDFNPAEVDYIILTHTHLDHIGRVPKLIKEGFNGTIITTKATYDLSSVVLLDAVHLMEENYATLYKKALRRGEEKKIKKPLYKLKDVQKVYKLPFIEASYHKEIILDDNIKITFFNAGHILGSASVKVEFIEDNLTKSIVFSGDIGSSNDLIMPPLESIENTNYLYLESTYGDRNHQPIENTIKEFKKAIIKTLEKDGNVIIPSFAIERTQEILYILKNMYDNGELPKCKVFLDSPMAIKATNLYEFYKDELNEKVDKKEEVFEFEYLQFTAKKGDSAKINSINKRAIIIAGSGMCNGGRILHHFKHRLWDKKNSLIFVGYQAHGTLGREIVDGAEWINIYGENIKIESKIYTINGFSAHADQKEMIKWIKEFNSLDKIFLIHGEKDKQKLFKKEIKREFDKKVHIVKEAEKIGI
jgi:metallo-beta-lactamase family protein